jgi:hypothetical protein
VGCAAGAPGATKISLDAPPRNSCVIALIDTHLLVWWIEGAKRLSRKQRRVIARVTAAEPINLRLDGFWSAHHDA